MRTALGAVATAAVIAACAGEHARTASSPPLSTQPAPSASASSAPAASAPVATATTSALPTAKTEPWCNDRYDNAPCVFRSFGECAEKATPGKRITEDDFGEIKCPPGDPPAFMNRPAVCGRRPNEPIVPTRSRFGGSPQCDRLATQWANVLHTDRACSSDADCTMIVGDGQCIAIPIAKAALARNKALATPPCGNPASGACAGPASRSRGAVVCEQGCCRMAMSGWGSIDPVYPKPALP